MEEDQVGDPDLHPGDKPHAGKQMFFCFVFFPPCTSCTDVSTHAQQGCFAADQPSHQSSEEAGSSSQDSSRYAAELN